MATVENASVTLTLPLSDGESETSHIECSNKVHRKSVAIVTGNFHELSSHSRRSSNHSNSSMSEDKLRQKSIEKRRSGKTLSMELVSYRLSRRRKLHEQW